MVCEPLSLAGTCIGLIGGIGSLTLHIVTFVNDVRGARKDMERVLNELSSLSLSLGSLQADCQSQRVDYPEAARQSLEKALLNIDVVTQQIKDLIYKLSAGKLGRKIQWALQSRDTVDKYRSSLETQKAVVEIALQYGSVQLLCKVQAQSELSTDLAAQSTDNVRNILEDTGIIRSQNADIRALIQAEATILKSEISALQKRSHLPADLQKWLNATKAFSQEVGAISSEPDTGLAFGNDSTVHSPRTHSTSLKIGSTDTAQDDESVVSALLEQLENREQKIEDLQHKLATLQAREDSTLATHLDKLQEREREINFLKDKIATLQAREDAVLPTYTEAARAGSRDVTAPQHGSGVSWRTLMNANLPTRPRELQNARTSVSRPQLREKELGRHGVPVYDVVFSPDGARLVSLGSDFSMMLWDTSTGQKLQRLDALAFSRHNDRPFETRSNVVFSPNDALVLLASCHGIRIWNVNTGKEQLVRCAELGLSSTSRLSPNGARVLVASKNLWPPGTSEHLRQWSIPVHRVVTIHEAATGALLRQLPEMMYFGSATFLADSARVAISSDRGLEIWNTSTGEILTTFDVKEIAGYNGAGLSFSPTSALFAVIFNDRTKSHYLPDTRHLRIGDANTGKQAREFPVAQQVQQAGEQPASRVEFSPDARTIATWSTFTINLWNVKWGKLMQRIDAAQLSQLPAYLSCVAFAPDGRFVATGAGFPEHGITSPGRSSGAVRLWKVRDSGDIFET